MAIFTVTSNDTLTLNGNVFNDMASDTVTKIDLPNELVNITTGKSGNSVIAQNAKGLNSNLTIKLNRGSSDDQFMNNILQGSLSDFPSIILLAGSFRKRLGDGQGNIVTDVYDLSGGVISKIPEGEENVSGDTAQGVVTYMVKFANTTRGIQ
jgi:hypothetical protein